MSRSSRTAGAALGMAKVTTAEAEAAVAVGAIGAVGAAATTVSTA